MNQMDGRKVNYCASIFSEILIKKTFISFQICAVHSESQLCIFFTKETPNLQFSLTSFLIQ